ncbi:hypothetical protein J6500_09945 [Bradyrhizobium sp. WSM 1704]|uniref:hypothetical protein n=1 Tax=Bradyrhizobium semiaridum TaxID=2821404 RepID=UPI001CE2923E|nr:hypothetical protein [Bradyrhizobium semiaridum]MCA6122206.1 hypothetical protein [Bradyrhizobium semiaridum]
MMWFKKTRPSDVWDEPVAEPLGDIEAAQRIRTICRAAADSAEQVGNPEARSAKKQQIERERYERAAKAVMEIAMKISDELVRDSAVREIVGLCMKANNMKTARALFRAIHAASIKDEVLKEHPSLADEPE